jgi:aminoglycoside 6'-N-acetyltransferase I
MKIAAVTSSQKDQWLEMASDLWPDHSRDELVHVFDEWLPANGLSLVAFNDPQNPVAFINFSLRHDYVEGSSTSPVGYIEGLFVKPGYRMQSIARMLVQAAEDWCRKKGCTEMGSDVELHNTISQQFHEAIGFEEANRIVCYIKRL